MKKSKLRSFNLNKEKISDLLNLDVDKIRGGGNSIDFSCDSMYDIEDTRCMDGDGGGTGGPATGGPPHTLSAQCPTAYCTWSCGT